MATRSNSTSDQNFKPTIVAIDSTDISKTVAIEGDPANGALLVEVVSGGGGGGSDVQYTDGATAPVHPIGTIPVYNNAGTITAVSAANPLPVSASINTTGLATSTKQSDGSQKTQIVDGSGNVIGSTSNALDINIKSGNPTSITANAGTNLNTSALALESGGNLAAIKADVDKIPSQGQALAAASMPVVLPAAQITTLTPPTTITANQGNAAGLTAGWPVIGGELADTTGTFTNATQTTSVTTTSFDGYSTVIVSINGTYGTATGVFEISDDGGTTWYSVNAARSDGSAIETGYTSLTNTNRMWTLSVSGADQFRIRSTAVASGTVNARISVESMPTPEAASITIPGTVAVTESGTWNVGANSAIGATIPANAFFIGGTDGTNLQGVRTLSPTNAQANTISLVTAARGQVHNGTNWDLLLSAAAATGTNGTGLLGTGILGWDGTNFRRLLSDTNGVLNIRQKSTTSTHSNVSTSTTSATLISSNALRLGGSIYNDSSAILYVATNGSAASTTNFKIAMAAGSYFEIPAGITTAVTGILSTGTGTARVDEDI